MDRARPDDRAPRAAVHRLVGPRRTQLAVAVRHPAAYRSTESWSTPPAARGGPTVATADSPGASPPAATWTCSPPTHGARRTSRDGVALAGLVGRLHRRSGAQRTRNPRVRGPGRRGSGGTLVRPGEQLPGLGSALAWDSRSCSQRGRRTPPPVRGGDRRRPTERRPGRPGPWPRPCSPDVSCLARRLPARTASCSSSSFLLGQQPEQERGTRAGRVRKTPLDAGNRTGG